MVILSSLEEIMKSKLALGSALIIFILVNLACQGAGPLSTIFATVTPTLTITPTATPTNIPSPTPLPTGVHFEEQPDKSTRIIDYDGGYTFELSEDWIALPADVNAIKDAIQKVSDSNPELA